MTELFEGYDSLSDNNRRLLTKQINFNDFHYCNLQAIVEAQSGLEAVKQFIHDKPWQVFSDFNEQPDINEENLKITAMDIRTSSGILRNNPDMLNDIQLMKFKISCGMTHDRFIWVYRMGDHWVICN